MVGGVETEKYRPFEHEIDDTMFLKFDCIVRFNKTAFREENKGFFKSDTKTHSQRFGLQSQFTLELIEGLNNEQLGNLVRQCYDRLISEIKQYEKNGNY